MNLDESILSIAPNVSIQCGQAGLEGEPYIQVDNFIEGAERLKAYAVEHGAFAPADSYYPGIRAAVPLIYTVALAKNLSGYISRYFGFHPRHVKKAVSIFSIVTQAPESLSLYQRLPHFDAPSRLSLAAIHYLGADEGGGTALYRHRNTGFEYVDAERYQPYMAAIHQQFADPQGYPPGYIHGDTDAFTQIHAFAARFNRLVLYRGSSLHSGVLPQDYSFDPDPATGRLTVTTFIEFSGT